MKDYDQVLRAKVEARNKCHAELNRLVPILTEALRPFVGTKILLKGCTQTNAKVHARIRNLFISEHNKFPDHQHYLSVSRYNVGVVSKICQPIGDDVGCVYAEAYQTVGEVNGNQNVQEPGVLTKLYEGYEPRRTDYTFEAVKILRDCIREQREKLHALEAEIIHFGEYDNG